ncbi:MAG TPA: 2,3-diphosphoglycerate-dependent phosphoglycerate mutase [Bacteroidales bacterium]|jgi:2,3-bisphosphoglycerate-dependent phosphoglycerate mutase|nr:2,3-diphosphoglycerate-dependent phosphoglycerate mutase [Bacteroidota bacterium]HJN05922.1 2,3-diphosphoglycerate-dependent phosphoglycerate mutase [Bacteroidales bacterium]|tara:strand:+ start:162 stop:908 length:747 start_codon:yes stop_codon:yes gene_type:complete
MKRLILVRHGQSVWNKENRFTGWTDMPLSEKGVAEAIKAGKILKENGFNFKVAFTSYLTRAIKTQWLILEEMDLMWIEERKTWRLNEKHYGILQGLNKIETAEKYGADMVQLWRRSFDTPPNPLDAEDERNPKFDSRYAALTADELPMTESLKEVIERLIPYWESEIKPVLHENNDLLITAHGNSLRALVMHLKNMSREEILGFNIPTGIPYIFELDDDLNFIKDYFLGDPEEIKILMEQVANQAKGK